jgi:hypothetical protein
MNRTIRTIRVIGAALVAIGAGAAIGWTVSAQAPQAQAADGPQYAADGKLIKPANYREWTFVTAGLGMTYGPAAAGATARAPRFDNVFVNPSSYRAFMQTGKWPDKTIFILEIRSSTSEASINKGGHFQTDLVAVEAAVKDEARFPNRWTYYNFGFGQAIRDTIDPLPTTATCYECHSKNTAVDWTFVQFYPTLFEVAKQKGTLNPSFNAAAAPQHD